MGEICVVDVVVNPRLVSVNPSTSPRVDRGDYMERLPIVDGDNRE